MFKEVRVGLSLILLSFLLLGCERKPSSHAESTSQTDIKPITESAWLYNNLPADTVLYLRLPVLMEFFSAKNDIFHAAQSNPKHIEQVKKLQSALALVASEQVPEMAKPLTNLLLENMQSPLELAVTAPQDNPMASKVRGTVGISLSGDEFNAWLTSLVTQFPSLQVLEPADAQGYGSIGVGPLVFVYQLTEKRLQFLAGMGLGRSDLESSMNGPTQPARADFIAMTQSIDDQNKGFVLWLDSAHVMQSVSAFMPPESLPFNELIQDNAISSLAMGFGSSGSKGRFRLVFELEEENALQAYFPQVEVKHSLTTVGEPVFVSQLNLPLQSYLPSLLSSLDKVTHRGDSNQDSELPGEEADSSEAQTLTESYQELNQEISAALGLNISDLLKAYGPELVFFKDQLGFFIGLKIRDQGSHGKVADALKNALANKESLLEKLPKDSESADDVLRSVVAGMEVVSHKVGGSTIHHLTVPSFYASALQNMPVELGVPPFAVSLLAGGHTHLYWIEQNGYLIFSMLPQDLMERLNSKNPMVLNDWLSAQKLRQEGSLLTLSGTLQGSPRNMYNAYLSAIQSLSDSVGADVDMFAFPPASTVSIPEKGLFSFQLDSNKQYLAAELTYEKSPLELLMAGQSSMAAIAAVGIVAAVALPAYQDYSLRAKVGAAVATSGNGQNILREFYFENGRLPTSEEFEQFNEALISEHIQSVYFDSEANRLVFSVAIGGDNSGEIYWQLESEENDLEFHCSSTYPDKVLPSICRTDLEAAW